MKHYTIYWNYAERVWFLTINDIWKNLNADQIKKKTCQMIINRFIHVYFKIIVLNKIIK